LHITVQGLAPPWVGFERWQFGGMDEHPLFADAFTFISFIHFQ
jgi:hypothetical protein